MVRHFGLQSLHHLCRLRVGDALINVDIHSDDQVWVLFRQVFDTRSPPAARNDHLRRKCSLSQRGCLVSVQNLKSLRVGDAFIDVDIYPNDKVRLLLSQVFDARTPPAARNDHLRRKCSLSQRGCLVSVQNLLTMRIGDALVNMPLLTFTQMIKLG
jgi:hypothetical protein